MFVSFCIVACLPFSWIDYSGMVGKKSIWNWLTVKSNFPPKLPDPEHTATYAYIVINLIHSFRCYWRTTTNRRQKAREKRKFLQFQWSSSLTHKHDNEYNTLHCKFSSLNTVLCKWYDSRTLKIQFKFPINIDEIETGICLCFYMLCFLYDTGFLVVSKSDKG